MLVIRISCCILSTVSSISDIMKSWEFTLFPASGYWLLLYQHVLFHLILWQLMGWNQGRYEDLANTNSADETTTQRKGWIYCVNKIRKDKWQGFMYVEGEEEDQLGAVIELPSPWRSSYYRYTELHMHYRYYCGCNKRAVQATARTCGLEG
jgi:hypothetical protein